MDWGRFFHQVQGWFVQDASMPKERMGTMTNVERRKLKFCIIICVVCVTNGKKLFHAMPSINNMGVVPIEVTGTRRTKINCSHFRLLS
jgi:hypothetical protein